MRCQSIPRGRSPLLPPVPTLQLQLTRSLPSTRPDHHHAQWKCLFLTEPSSHTECTGTSDPRPFSCCSLEKQISPLPASPTWLYFFLFEDETKLQPVQRCLPKSQLQTTTTQAQTSLQRPPHCPLWATSSFSHPPSPAAVPSSPSLCSRLFLPLSDTGNSSLQHHSCTLIPWQCHSSSPTRAASPAHPITVVLPQTQSCLPGLQHPGTHFLTALMSHRTSEGLKKTNNEMAKILTSAIPQEEQEGLLSSEIRQQSHGNAPTANSSWNDTVAAVDL